MKTTRVSELINTRYPIIQGGMLWLADAGLAGAVSNAGGLGVISPMAGMEEDGEPIINLELQVSKAKELTSNPFGVNVPLDLRDSGLLMDMILAFQIPVVITAAGDPRLYTEFLKSSGVVVLHVVSNVKHALSAQTAGVDAVIVEGVEAAARNGFDELPLFSLIPQVADAVDIPVVAAGGIVDSRGVVAAMALGAEGVQLGTRFVAVTECIAAREYKDAIVAAADTGTAITNRALIPTRSIKTPFTMILLELAASGASGEEIRDFMGRAASRRGGLEGDLENGEAYAGSSSGLIKSIVSTAEAMAGLVDDYGAVVESLK